MITAAYIGFGVSVREYHIPYVENRDDIRAKYVYRRKKKVVGRHVICTAPAGEDRWGTLVYIDGDGNQVAEKVPVGCAHYERIYDSLAAAITKGAEKCVKDEEVVRVLEILEEATPVAKSHKC